MTLRINYNVLQLITILVIRYIKLIFLMRACNMIIIFILTRKCLTWEKHTWEENLRIKRSL